MGALSQRFFFGWERSPKMDYRKKVVLILTSLLEDLVEQWALPGCECPVPLQFIRKLPITIEQQKQLVSSLPRRIRDSHLGFRRKTPFSNSSVDLQGALAIL